MEEIDNPRLRDILDEAADMPPEQRDDFLGRACAGNSSLRSEVELLLASLDEASEFLTTPTVDQPAVDVGLQGESDYPPPVVVREGPGTFIGPYKLLEQIGEGGMGVVFRAEQERPVRRTVALKIIKPGMDSAQVIARLEAERQALAMMDHPNIARVYDAGATESGRPYFVMELVQGVPITHYCDQRYLTPQERLELFITVCQALQHAHQKGIIHRDLKPSNVLVMTFEGKPVAKVIDFGVAKALHQKLTEKTLFTQFGHVIGTPEYMSPEQAELDVGGMDTRSDIYSLGVLLYELLTGSTPLDRKALGKAGYGQMLKTIRETDPPKPSTKVGWSIRDAGTRGREDAELEAVCERRAMEPRRLVRLLSGDLDWIIMKCLEKDRSRRYETANGLARDIERYLADEPVEASPPSAGYLLRKFVRKHRIPIGVAAAFIALLLAATVVSAWQAVRLARAADIAKNATTEAEAVAASLESIFKGMNPGSDEKAAPDANKQMVLQLDEAAARVATNYANEPLLRARLRNALGEAAMGLGESVKAEGLFQAALDDQRPRLAPDDPALFATLHNIADVYLENGRVVDAIKLFEQVRDRRIQKLGPNHADTLKTLSRLAWAYHQTGDYVEMVKLLEQVRDGQIRALGPDHRDTLATLSDLADGYKHLERFDESIKLFEQVRDRQTAKLGAEHPDTLSTIGDLGLAYKDAGRYADAITVLEQARELKVKKLGPDHPDALLASANVASAYGSMGRTAESLELFEQVRKRVLEKLGPDHRIMLSALSSFADAHGDAGNYAEMARLLEDVRDRQNRVLGPDHRNTLQTLAALAYPYRMLGRLKESLKLLEQVREKQAAKFGPDDPDTLDTLGDVAVTYDALHRTPEAIPIFEHVRDVWVKRFGPDHPRTLTMLCHLAKAYIHAGRTIDAIGLLERARDGQIAKLGADHPKTLLTLGNLAFAYGQVGDHEAALKLEEQVHDKFIKILGPNHPETLIFLNNLAASYQSVGRTDEAIKLFEQVSDLTVKKLGPDHPTSLRTLGNLANAYRKAGRTDEATKLLDEVRDRRTRMAAAANREGPTTNPSASTQPVAAK